MINALILLNCDESQGHQGRRTNLEIAQMLQASERKIERVKRRFVEESLEVALNGQASQREYVGKIDGEVEAHLVTMSCSALPAGHARWSLCLLVDRAVELDLQEVLSHESVRQTLKKRPQALEEGEFRDRAEASAEFVAPMERVLDVCQRPY